MIDHKLKYLAPAAAFTTLFLVGCGDEDEVNTNKDLLIGNWNVISFDGDEYDVEICQENVGITYCYTYSMNFIFEADGDFILKTTFDGNDANGDYSDVYLYEGDWEFTSAAEDNVSILIEDLKNTLEGNLNIKSISKDKLSGVWSVNEDTNYGYSGPIELQKL